MSFSVLFICVRIVSFSLCSVRIVSFSVRIVSFSDRIVSFSVRIVSFSVRIVSFRVRFELCHLVFCSNCVI